LIFQLKKNLLSERSCRASLGSFLKLTAKEPSALKTFSYPVFQKIELGFTVGKTEYPGVWGWKTPRVFIFQPKSKKELSVTHYV
jgi:hypothetical protein